MSFQGNNVHAERIRIMCENNEESLVIMHVKSPYLCAVN